jgi:hypothetical protein
MNQLAPIIVSRAPTLVAASGARASYRFLEFFTAQIRNPHTLGDWSRHLGGSKDHRHPPVSTRRT